MSIRLLVCDDHQVIRTGLAALLAGTEIEIIGEADSGKETLRQALKLKPDVILLAHGAARSEALDAQFILDHTQCHGVQLGSSIERLAVEQPLQQRAAAFKEIRFPAVVKGDVVGRAGK